MGRPNKTAERRKKLIPVITAVFAELGYRRATTAELAKRCGVQENILYRLWPDKKAMFIASIEHRYLLAAELWTGLVNRSDPNTTPAERVLSYEAEHFGEGGLYRIVFAGLNETDDPDVHEALREMYGRFHRFIRKQIATHRDGAGRKSSPNAELSAWAFVGLGTVVNIGLELGLLTDRQRRRLVADVGRVLLEGQVR